MPHLRLMTMPGGSKENLQIQRIALGPDSKGPRTQIIGFQGPDTINSIISVPYDLGPWNLRANPKP